MTKVAILPVAAETGEVSYHAVAGERRSSGRTAGEALDALAAQLGDDDQTLVVIQTFRPDRFFPDAQRSRLATLMERWRAAGDGGEGLSADERAELNALIDAELLASGERAARMADDLGR